MSVFARLICKSFPYVNESKAIARHFVSIFHRFFRLGTTTDVLHDGSNYTSILKLAKLQSFHENVISRNVLKCVVKFKLRNRKDFENFVQ